MAEPSSLVLESSPSGLQIGLHPLAILNVTEHYTRVTIQLGSSSAVRVIGALTGTQTGRDIEVLNSFEVPLLDNGKIDSEFFEARRDQFKQVFPNFDFLGWYSVGTTPTVEDLALHEQFTSFNESPLFLQLSPHSLGVDKNLPVSIYEPVVEIIQNVPRTMFAKASYTIETGEAERIAVDYAAKPSDTVDADSLLIANLSNQRNAIKMLHDRVSLLIAYLDEVSKSNLPMDHSTLRQINALVASLPATATDDFKQESVQEQADARLTGLLAAQTKHLERAHELIDKFGISTQPVSGSGSHRPPRMGSRDGRRGFH